MHQVRIGRRTTGHANHAHQAIAVVDTPKQHTLRARHRHTPFQAGTLEVSVCWCDQIMYYNRMLYVVASGEEGPNQQDKREADDDDVATTDSEQQTSENGGDGR